MNFNQAQKQYINKLIKKARSEEREKATEQFLKIVDFYKKKNFPFEDETYEVIELQEEVNKLKELK